MMDQNSSNGSTTDKRNWRERLGIGTKDMPRIADEFKTPAEPVLQTKPAVKAPQPVLKPAPMAPRAAPQKAAAAAAPAKAVAAAPAKLAPAAPHANGELPRAPQPSAPQSNDVLAEKLRAQRLAAEKLAEQRVSAARERAEAKAAAAPAAEPKLAIPRQPAAGETAKAATVAAPSKPKFSFAEEELSPARKEAEASAPQSRQTGTLASPMLVPPRPALGGERQQPSMLRPAPPQPLRPEAPPPFRPIDPATGYPPAAGRSGGLPPRGYGAAAAGYGGGRVPAQRPAAYEPYRRTPEPPPPPYRGSEEPLDDPRGDPRLGRSMAARGRRGQAEEDYGDVFEDEPPKPRRRASASEYNSAYREAEEGYEEDRRRSGGPWLLLLALLLAAIATGAIIWYYQTKIKTATTATGTDNVPVVAAPEQPAKAAAEKPADEGGDTPAVGKKEIYDRIVGDQEVSGSRVVPTEEPPVQPEASPSGDGGDQSGIQAIPEPSAASDTSGTAIDEPVPLPLPPPPGDGTGGSGDTQGSLEQIAPAGTGQQSASGGTKTIGSSEQTATTGAVTGGGSTATTGQGASVQSAGVETITPVDAKPVDAKAEGTAALLPATGDTDGTAETGQASPPKDEKPAVAEPEAPAKKKPAAPKKVATKKKTTSDDLGAEPVVLVPPSQYVAPSQDAGSGQQTADGDGLQQGTAPTAKKKKTLFDLLDGNPSQQDASTGTSGMSRATTGEKQVASLPPPQPEKPAQSGTGGSGYVVQLASFRSEAEAQTEYGRLRNKYPDVIGGLQPRIVQATVGGSTRYRLGLGPLATREQASRICGSLVAGGERDCLIRRQ